MKNYLVKTPRLLKLAYSNCIWHVREHANSIYLTFDDGPHPEITPWVLDLLDKFEAKATFFCIGKNVSMYPDVFQEIIDRGHAIGNHTDSHLNGFKSENIDYFKDIAVASKKMDTQMFRPPYGRLTYSQGIGIRRMFPEMKIIMWDVLSGDFDTSIKPKECLKNVIDKSKTGSIVVFHDSEKAHQRLEYTLPRFLAYCKKKKWKMKKLKIKCS